MVAARIYFAGSPASPPGAGRSALASAGREAVSSGALHVRCDEGVMRRRASRRPRLADVYSELVTVAVGNAV